MDKIAEEALGEVLIGAWVQLTGALKNTRMTQGMNYNEAIVMMLAYNRFREDGEGRISFGEITEKTKMLKSLVNRTITALEQKGLLERCEGRDKRMTFVRPVRERLDVFLAVHNQSLALAQAAIAVVGEEDIRTFVRISDKIAGAELLAPDKK